MMRPLPLIYGVLFFMEFTREELNNEEWRDVPNYEGLYQVSNLGRVKSLSRRKRCGTNRTGYVSKEFIMSPYTESNGYKRIRLSKHSNAERYGVHQLVAMAFLGHKRAGHSAVVDHINHNKTDNRVNNLRIITQRENNGNRITKSASKYVGVFKNKNYPDKWSAMINIRGKVVFLGSYESEVLAHNAYIKSVKNLHLYNGDNISFRKRLGIFKEKNKSSKYKYVSWNKNRNKWYVNVNGVYGGCYSDEYEAYLASIRMSK